nr:MAG TPA: hypothetical protein [Caudoviricetes sp.]
MNVLFLRRTGNDQTLCSRYTNWLSFYIGCGFYPNNTNF